MSSPIHNDDVYLLCRQTNEKIPKKHEEEQEFWLTAYEAHISEYTADVASHRAQALINVM